MYLATVAADFDAELEELTMDAGRSPERVGGVHLPNQFTNLAIYRWSSGPRAPTPIAPKSLTVPLDHRCRLDQDHHLQTARPQSVEPDQEQAVDREQPGSPRPLATKNMQLMAQGEVL